MFTTHDNNIDTGGTSGPIKEHNPKKHFGKNVHNAKEKCAYLYNE